jgi:hypothetical protein
MSACAGLKDWKVKTKLQKDPQLLKNAAKIAMGLVPLAAPDKETEIWVRMEGGKPVHVFSPDIDIAAEDLVKVCATKDAHIEFVETNSALQQLIIDELSKLEFGDLIIKSTNGIPVKVKRKFTYKITENLKPIHTNGSDTVDRITNYIDGYLKQFYSKKDGKVMVRLVDGRPLTISIEIDTALSGEHKDGNTKKQPWYKQLVKKELMQLNFGYLTLKIANGFPAKIERESSLKIFL